MELIEPIINDAPQHAAFCALTHLNRTPVAAGGSSIGTGGTKTDECGQFSGRVLIPQPPIPRLRLSPATHRGAFVVRTRTRDRNGQ
jgi:hypothetical protein